MTGNSQDQPSTRRTDRNRGIDYESYASAVGQLLGDALPLLRSPEVWAMVRWSRPVDLDASQGPPDDSTLPPPWRLDL